MNKKIVYVLIALIIIVLLFVSFFKFINFKQTTKSNVNNETNNTTTQEVKEEKKEFEDFEIDIPANYIIISEDKITSMTDMFAKVLAYYYDEKENNTLVNVYLQNRGEKAFYHDAVCVISFLDKDGNELARFGGVIEEDRNIEPGGTTVVKTNFLSEPGEVSSVIVDFENVKEVLENEIVEEQHEGVNDTKIDSNESTAIE